MSSKILYYKDVTHRCGHVIRYEFSLPRPTKINKEVLKVKSSEMSQELASLGAMKCASCEIG